ncbi:MAG: hypothetical protein LBT08_07365 [Synergistaceae bacterium]|jgi:hypothetical protein|nr:hypothetical protein [Synergistaceae bacterium]
MKCFTKKPRGFLAFIVMLAVFISLAPPAVALDVEDVVEAGMREALSEAGMRRQDAERVARQYLFIGTVIIKNFQPGSLAEEEEFLSVSKNAGISLGKALGVTHRLYGTSKLQDTATVMMHSARAGVLPEVASDTFSTLILNGYAFDASISLLHEISEAVRSMKAADGGSAICGTIMANATENVTLGELKREIVVSVDQERARQRALIAKNEEERRRRDSGGGKGDDRVASSSGGESGVSPTADGGEGIGKGGDESSSGGAPGGEQRQAGSSESDSKNH